MARSFILLGGLLFGWGFWWGLFYMQKQPDALWMGQLWGMNMTFLHPFLIIFGWALLWTGIVLCEVKL